MATVAVLAQTAAESQLMHSLASSATAVTVLDSATQAMARAAELAPVMVSAPAQGPVQRETAEAAKQVAAQAMATRAAT